MVPSRAMRAGRAYLDLWRKARSDRRPVDELLQPYVLESFVARLAGSRFAERSVPKDGVLLAALGERRPTRDVDPQAQALDNDAETIRAAVSEVASRYLEGGQAVVRGYPLVALGRVLDGYGAIGQQRRVAWRRKQRLDDHLPERFSEVVSGVAGFADLAIVGVAAGRRWDPTNGTWS